MISNTLIQCLYVSVCDFKISPPPQEFFQRKMWSQPDNTQQSIPSEIYERPLDGPRHQCMHEHIFTIFHLLIHHTCSYNIIWIYNIYLQISLNTKIQINIIKHQVANTPNQLSFSKTLIISITYTCYTNNMERALTSR